MPDVNRDMDAELARAVASFWRTRRRQGASQGRDSGKRDAGSRTAVTGGRQLDGLIRLVRKWVGQAGLPGAAVVGKGAALPGYFRPTKVWDLLVIADSHLIASLEFKSHIGPSFGNNFNNRIEEALGSATDLWTAHREGAFSESVRPWLGYFMLLEDTRRSAGPVVVRSPHFAPFAEFENSSYARRYELFCQRLVRERLYDAACLILSPADRGMRGVYSVPNGEISPARLKASLMGRVAEFAAIKTPPKVRRP